MNIRIFEVGGSIRNEILGRKVKDRDFAVICEQGYEGMKAWLSSMGCTIYQERPQFVSIKAKHPFLGAVDFTLARKESFYTDARHPDKVNPAETIEEDLARRDFTMNAIAREIGTDTLIDPFGGQKDINAATICCVGKAADRLNEDRLRVLRAIRFACELNFTLDYDIQKAIHDFKHTDFPFVSTEMIQVELEKAFRADSKQAMEHLISFPEIGWLTRFRGIWFRPTTEKK